MANSGQIVVNPTNFNTLEFNWAQVKEIENNRSRIAWEIILSSNTWGTIVSSADKKYQVNIDGQLFEGTNNVGISANSQKRIAQGTAYVPHNADGSKTISISFSQQFDILFDGSNVSTARGSDTAVLDTIPRAATITGAPNFTDSDSPTITYSNPAGSSVTALQACISIVGGSGGDDIPYRDIPPNGTSYTFTFSTAELATLRNAVRTGNSIQVRFYVLTNLGGTLYSNYTTRTFSLNDANPKILSYSAEDTSAQALALTGNKNYWIKGVSDVKFNFEAEAQANSVINNYTATCGQATINTAYGTFTNVTSNTISFFVADSRGNTANAAISSARWIDYNGLSCVMTASDLDTNGNLQFTVSGVYFMGSFGATTNNITVEYRYKSKSASEFGAWTIAPIVASQNSYSSTGTITGLYYREDYVIEFRATDKVQTVYSETYNIHKTVPIFDWSKNDFSLNVPTYADEIILRKETGGINAEYSDGMERNVLGLDENDTLCIGLPAKVEQAGDLYLGGNDMTITSNHNIFIDAPDGLYINMNRLADFVVEQGDSGYWSYRKWNSGLCEMWGWCQANYQAAHFLSSYQAFPVALVDWISAMGTVNGFSGNLAAYLGVNVKIECLNYGCNVWVQNPSNTFESGASCGVSLSIVGKWK